MLKEKSYDDYIRLCILYVKIKITQYVVEKAMMLLGSALCQNLTRP